MDMQLIAALASVPAVVALVTLLKDLGMPARLGPLAAVLLGVALAALAALGADQPTQWYETLSTGVILGLSASGLYDGARAFGSKSDDHVIVLEDPKP